MHNLANESEALTDYAKGSQFIAILGELSKKDRWTEESACTNKLQSLQNHFNLFQINLQKIISAQ